MGNINHKYDSKAIGSRIKEERKKLGYSQEKLGFEIGFTRRTVSSWENGESLPDLDTMLELCGSFDCELGYLLCEYDTKTRTATDICKETGLSEKALNALKRSVDFLQACENLPISPINYLLESGKTADLIHLLSDEVFYKKQCLPIFNLLDHKVKEDLYYMFKQASFETLSDIFYTERTEKDRYICLLRRYFEDLNSDELLSVFQPIFNYPNEKAVQKFISEYKDKPKEEILEVLIEEIVYYSYQALVYEVKQKERFFKISDTFLDLIKSYLNECEEVE